MQLALMNRINKFSHAEREPIINYKIVKLKTLDPDSGQIRTAASAVLCAFKRNGPSEVSMGVVI